MKLKDRELLLEILERVKAIENVVCMSDLEKARIRAQQNSGGF